MIVVPAPVPHDLEPALAAFLEDRAAGVPYADAFAAYLTAADLIITARLEPLP